MGIELEWASLFVLCVLGTSVFDRFEVETPPARKAAKWVVAAGVTVIAFAVVGHWALAGLTVFAGVGVAVHVAWCRRHGIDARTAAPRRRYYELRGWSWPE